MRHPIGFTCFLVVLAMGLILVLGLFHPLAKCEECGAPGASQIAHSNSGVLATEPVRNDVCEIPLQSVSNLQDTPGQPAACSIEGLWHKSDAP